MVDLALILKDVLESSTVLTGWAVAIGAGTVAIIIGTSHNRPESLHLRLTYLLFLPGWTSIAYSIYLGNKLVGSYLASRFTPNSVLDIADNINNLYASQRLSLLIALAFFGTWLICYTLAWIFTKQLKEPD